MRKPSQGSVAALLIGVATLTYLGIGLGYRLGTPARPGSGFFPLVLGLAGLGLAAMCLLRADRASRLAARPKAVVFVLAVIVFAALIEPAGFIPVGIGFTALMVRLLGSRNPWQIAVMAVVVPVAMYALFVEGFGVVLPKGILGWIF